MTSSPKAAPRRVRIPRWIALATGGSFYTAVGALFFAPNPLVRFVVFGVLWLIWRCPRLSLVVVGLAALLTGSAEFLLGASPLDAATTGVGWACLAGTMLLALQIYPSVFHGADWATVGLAFGEKRGGEVALVAFFVYRALPELEARVRRIVRALRTYGHRLHRGSVLLPALQIIDGLTIYFVEAIDILLAQRRVAERRQGVLWDAARARRPVDARTVLLGSWLVTVLVSVSLGGGWALMARIGLQ